MNPLRAITLKLISVMVFVAMVTCLKAAGFVPPGQLVFFRSFFALVPVVGYIAWVGQMRTAFRTDNPMGHMWRGVVGVTSMALSFTALGLLPLPEVTAIGYGSPLLATLLAPFLLGETVRMFRLTAVVIGLIGVLVIVAPRLTLFANGWPDGGEGLGVAAALASAVSAACAMLLVRRLVQVEATLTVVFWFTALGALMALGSLPFGWISPDPAQAALLVGAGLFGGVGQILLTESYRHADASTIAPFEYTSMVFAIAVGYLLFAEKPTGQTLIGAAIVAAAGVLVIWRERRLGIDRSRAKTVTTLQG